MAALTSSWDTSVPRAMYGGPESTYFMLRAANGHDKRWPARRVARASTRWPWETWMETGRETWSDCLELAMLGSSWGMAAGGSLAKPRLSSTRRSPDVVGITYGFLTSMWTAGTKLSLDSRANPSHCRPAPHAR